MRERKSYLIYRDMFAKLFKFTGVAIKRTLYFDIFFKAIFLPCRVPTFRDQKVVKHGRNRVPISHSCILIELGPICKSMAASL